MKCYFCKVSGIDVTNAKVNETNRDKGIINK